MSPAKKPKSVIETYLRSLSVDELVDLLLTASATHEPLRQRLEADAATERVRAHGVSTAEMKRLKALLDDVIIPYDYISYRAASHWARSAGTACDVLQDLIDAEQWEAVVELSEHAIVAFHQAIESVDDSDGNFGALVDDILLVHHEGCVGAQSEPLPPGGSLADPVRLAGIVFTWSMDNEYGLLDGVFSRYVDVLGNVGLEAIGKLIAPRLASAATGHREFTIRHLAEQYAEATGTLDDVVTVLAQDLSSGYSYLRIAERLAKAGRHDDGLRWALDGIATHGSDHRLHDFVIAEHLRAGRGDDALGVATTLHAAAATVATFTRVRDVARQLGRWDAQRDQTFAVLRRALTKQPATTADPRRLWTHPAGFGPLVEAYLLDQQPDQAWAAGLEGGCSQELWLRLAKTREATHPADAIPIYLRHLEATIDRKKNDAYASAVTQLQHLRSLYAATGDGDGFTQLLDSVKVQHKAKRNLMALLAQERFR